MLLNKFIYICVYFCVCIYMSSYLYVEYNFQYVQNHKLLQTNGVSYWRSRLYDYLNLR